MFLSHTSYQIEREETIHERGGRRKVDGMVKGKSGNVLEEKRKIDETSRKEIEKDGEIYLEVDESKLLEMEAKMEIDGHFHVMERDEEKGTIELLCRMGEGLSFVPEKYRLRDIFADFDIDQVCPLSFIIYFDFVLFTILRDIHLNFLSHLSIVPDI